MTDRDHEELVKNLLSLKGKVLLSGYGSPLYEPLTGGGWNTLDIPTTCSAAGRTRKTGLQNEGHVLVHQARTETLWWNYPVSKPMEQICPIQKGGRHFQATHPSDL